MTQIASFQLRRVLERPVRAVLVMGLAIAVLVLTASWATLPALAEPHPDLQDFQLSGQYVLFVDDELEPDATLYYSQPSTAYLVVSEAFEEAILVLPRTGCVETIKPEEMKEREDGGIDLVLEATPCRLGRFKLVGSDVAFQVREAKVRLKPKPALIGTHWSSKLIEHSPEYGRNSKTYEPDEAKMGILKESETEARIQIFFGTWCSFCNRFLPNTIKVEEELKKHGTKLSFEFHGLPAPPAAWATKEATQMRVRRLPTGLIFVDGKLVGRLEGNDWIRPEVSLTRYIK